jgi:SpoIID/LytB domain protein
VRFLQVTGKGFGHGRGLGQWGSYGYAVEQGWPAARILDHFYGGTMAGPLPPGTAVQRVRLQGFDGRAVTIVQPRGTLTMAVALSVGAGVSVPSPVSAVAPAPPGSTVAAAGGPVPVAVAATGSPPVLPSPGAAPPDTGPPPAPSASSVSSGGAGSTAPAAAVAVRVQMVAPNRYQVSDGPGCDGPFTPRAVLDGPGVLLTADASGGSMDPTRNPEPSEMVQVCVGTTRRAYRGDLLVSGEGSSQRLVNVVAMESYLRSVVPSESPPGWADRPNGIEALKAQSVAARSYAAAERRSGPANTCDSTACQVYRGRGEFRSGGFVSFEDARTDRAIVETAGVVRLWPNGTVVRTEFSSSTGGFTAPGEFPVVGDEGDATGANPYRAWTVRLPAERLEAGRGLGSFVGAEVTRRDGTGPDGGRARRVRLTFSGGSVEIPSSELSGRFGFRSSYYSLAVMERTPGTTLEVGDVFQPTDPGLVGTSAGAALAPPDSGPVMAGSPEPGGPASVAAGATATTVSARRSGQTTTTRAPVPRSTTARPSRSPTTTRPVRSGSAAASADDGPVVAAAKPATRVGAGTD